MTKLGHTCISKTARMIMMMMKGDDDDYDNDVGSDYNHSDGFHYITIGV